MSVSTDPFTQVEAAIWTALEARAIVTNIVKVANRLRFSDQKPQLRQPSNSADLPEIAIAQRGGEFNAPGSGFSSSSFSITQRYDIMVQTDDNSTADTRRSINPIKWAVFCALQLLFANTETIPGLTYVRQCRLGSFNDALTPSNNDAAPRDFRGWSSVMQFQVVMVFDRLYIQALATGV